MAKTELTHKLEHDIWRATHKQGVFCCYEVTIGWFGRERVDYMTYDTKGVWRCYEIKVSKSDFHSKAAHTFCGNFNYFVMTRELYEQVKDEISDHVGVFVGDYCEKRAKRQQLTVDEQTLKDSMIRSLYREVEKQIKSNSLLFIAESNRKINALEKDLKYSRKDYYDLINKLHAKYGRHWEEELFESEVKTDE